MVTNVLAVAAVRWFIHRAASRFRGRGRGGGGDVMDALKYTRHCAKSISHISPGRGPQMHITAAVFHAGRPENVYARRTMRASRWRARVRSRAGVPQCVHYNKYVD